MTIPEKLLDLLEKEKLCFLSTSHQDQPHVSLMNFTYLPENDLIILTSRANTTKMSYINHNPCVALLFTSLSETKHPPVSCTVYGKAHVTNPNQDDFYRQAHLQRHPGMESFIIGEHIAVVTVQIQHGTIANIQDQVSNWSAEDATSL
ncbi:pyridoxamine 5'-phosphate oxidase family protein [Anoxynatronum buryatiense]|uniref:Pyridoxamine 5'-phosphate oxidase n=1 Tax=Anoxynatronum buryatiense TaxID=489973 RepID=A0AA45WYW6_9CLOT|nr:pyridoxamine 5'-phosphate oxidase family protein [Anoxynatronum buryatiense]SMP70696.1 Pyridoxamine 5'-phosphate oxidase [Anoxynatronum buryatiense]